MTHQNKEKKKRIKSSLTKEKLSDNDNKIKKTKKEQPQAISDRIFVRLIERENTSKGGLIFFDNTIQPRTIGIVESFGPLVTSVKKGDKILFHVFDELPTYDPDVVVIRQASLLGVFA